MFATTITQPRAIALDPGTDWGYVVTADGRVLRAVRRGDLLVADDGDVLGSAPGLPDPDTAGTRRPPGPRSR